MENNIDNLKELKAKVKEQVEYTNYLKEKYKYVLSDNSINDIDAYIQKIENNYRKLMEELKQWQK